MTREQAINYLYCSGFSEEQVSEVVRALTYEPTPKNDLGVDCISRDAVKYYIQAHIHEIITESGIDKNAHTNGILRALLNGVDTMPSVTPQLSVPEVTALAEWTEKLTKASEEAYNKGYADGANEVLDKLRAEIEAEPYVSKMEVLDIIDEYKAESEEV